MYKELQALHTHQFDWQGFEWIDMGDAQGSTLSYIRKGHNPDEVALVICNFTPVVRNDFRVGLPFAGEWELIANSDELRFGGSGVEPEKLLTSEDEPWHGRKVSTRLTLPPLATIVLIPKLG